MAKGWSYREESLSRGAYATCVDYVSNLIWSRLDIETIEAGEKVKRPDLSRIRSVGWTDLLVGEGSPGCRRRPAKIAPRVCLCPGMEDTQ